PGVSSPYAAATFPALFIILSETAALALADLPLDPLTDPVSHLGNGPADVARNPEFVSGLMLPELPRDQAAARGKGSSPRSRKIRR
ncbi:hypothetical protein HK096_000797, partial [Nowakowskiella sp. JEL0078]